MKSTFLCRLVLTPLVSRASDPGHGSWRLVDPRYLKARCGVDPEKLLPAARKVMFPFLIVRFGELCFEHLPRSEDRPSELFSATKTLAGLVAGVVSWQTRELPRNRRKAGALVDTDGVDHWLDHFSVHEDAQIGHILGMVAQSRRLTPAEMVFDYDYLEPQKAPDVPETCRRL